MRKKWKDDECKVAEAVSRRREGMRKKQQDDEYKRTEVVKWREGMRKKVTRWWVYGI